MNTDLPVRSHSETSLAPGSDDRWTEAGKPKWQQIAYARGAGKETEMRKIRVSDGWHIIANHRVYVESGIVMRGMKRDYNGGLVPSAVYRWSKKYRCWVNESGCNSVDAFRAGVKRGTITMM